MVGLRFHQAYFNNYYGCYGGWKCWSSFEQVDDHFSDTLILSPISFIYLFLYVFHKSDWSDFTRKLTLPMLNGSYFCAVK